MVADRQIADAKGSEEHLRKAIRDKKERHRIQCERALAAWDQWLGAIPQPADNLTATSGRLS